jgi:phosphatidylinositol 3-kinase
MSQPSTVAITNLDQDLLWKYRFFLTAEKKALTRFLKCVDWSDTQAKPNPCRRPTVPRCF